MSTPDNRPPGSSQVVAGGSLPDEAGYGEQLEHKPVSRLVFQMAGHGLLLDPGTPMEFLERQAPFHIPNAQPLFVGLINRRGSLVPVFDIRKLIDEDPRPTGECSVLVLGTGDDAVAVVLDATPFRATIMDEQRAAAPVALVQVFGEFLGDCFEQDGGYLSHIDLKAFLLALVAETK